MSRDPLRHHRRHRRADEGAFGSDRFGQAAERFARIFGTPTFIIVQTLIVIAWITLNALGVFVLQWDPYPFILLNLAFSTQAAYAAPLILLAQSRQAERDSASEEANAIHREELDAENKRLLRQNTELTEAVHKLSVEIRDLLKKRRVAKATKKAARA